MINNRHGVFCKCMMCHAHRKNKNPLEGFNREAARHNHLISSRLIKLNYKR